MAKEVFERLILTTGGDEEAYILQKRDAFFTHVLGEIGLQQNICYATVETHFLTRNAPVSFEPQYPTTDDALHKLVLFDELIAMVMDRRDDFNRHEVTFWQTDPSPSCQDQLNEVKQSLQQKQQAG